MNIKPLVLNHAYRSGLEAISTGGGCDYIIRGFKNGSVAVLSSAEDGGCSPDNLIEESCVTIYRDNQWLDGMTFKFTTARFAMQWMSNLSEPIFEQEPTVEKQTQATMKTKQQESTEVILKRGFRQPPDWMNKPDPRGSEYGFFSAVAKPDGSVTVIKREADDYVGVTSDKHVEFEVNPVRYRMEFPTASDFEKWSQDCA